MYQRILLVLISFFFLQPGFSQGKSKDEFIRDFTQEKFIVWPEKKESFTIAIVNDSALFKALEPYYAKKPLFKKRKVKLEYMADFNQALKLKSGVVYIHHDNGVPMAQAIAAFKGKPVLVVGENYPFNQSMINFVVFNNKLSFEYNEDLIKEQGLTPTDDLEKLSSKNEIQWNKMLAETEARLQQEKELLEQKNKQLDESNQELDKSKNKLNYSTRYLHQAYKNLSEKELLLLEKDSMLDSASRELLISQLKIAHEEDKVSLKDAENAHKEAVIAGQKKFIATMIIAIVLAVVALFFIVRSWRMGRKTNHKLNELNKSLKQHKDEIFLQKTIVEAKKKEMTDSINYALNIQKSLLPPLRNFSLYLPESFILFRPKDIVSGDFYWIEQPNSNQVLFTVVDCTGHGVPGALMSVIGVNQLNKIIRENKVYSPEKVLELLDRGVTESLQGHQHENVSHDGMDLAFCMLDKSTNTLHFSGANNPLWIVTKNPSGPGIAAYTKGNIYKNGEYSLVEIGADKKSIASQYKTNSFFKLHSIQLSKGDQIYIFSDGFADQFGGASAKKFKKARFKELLVSMSGKPMNDQKNTILKTFEDWKGTFEQIDDVCVMGVRI